MTAVAGQSVAGQSVTALPGSRFPLGATVSGGGTNFAVASAAANAKNATNGGV